MEADARTIGLGLLAALAAVQTTRLWWRTASRRWAFARRRARGREGEVEAEAMLERLGYQIIERQVRAHVRYWIDEAPHDAQVIADLLVSRDGARYLAEVKTGSKATDPMHRATRRQLLEYAHAFDVRGLLLVDADAGTVRSFRAPPSKAPASGWLWLLGGVAVGVATYSLLS